MCDTKLVIRQVFYWQSVEITRQSVNIVNCKWLQLFARYCCHLIYQFINQSITIVGIGMIEVRTKTQLILVSVCFAMLTLGLILAIFGILLYFAPDRQSFGILFFSSGTLVFTIGSLVARMLTSRPKPKHRNKDTVYSPKVQYLFYLRDNRHNQSVDSYESRPPSPCPSILTICPDKELEDLVLDLERVNRF